jgi:hypothetical protein
VSEKREREREREKRERERERESVRPRVCVASDNKQIHSSIVSKLACQIKE